MDQTVSLEKKIAADPRLNQILELLRKYSDGDFKKRGIPSANGDSIDAIIVGLNTLAEEIEFSGNLLRNFKKRADEITTVLMKYTLFDFSEKAAISKVGDELDAIAVGLNTMAEELVEAEKIKKQKEKNLLESKDQVESILTYAPNAAVVINEEGEIIRWNIQSENIFGWKAEEVLGKIMYELIMPPQYIEAHKNGFAKFLKSGEGPILNKTRELSALRKNGEEFPMEITISATKIQNKYIFIAFINDITEQKKSEAKIVELYAELAKKIDELQVVNKDLEAFAHSVSHDLRAPLRAINGYIKILETEYFQDADKEAITVMNSVSHNALKMEHLIEDLLKFSRLGRKELQKTQVDLNELVKEAIEEVKKALDMSKTEMIVHPLPTVPADHNLLLQAFINLISNAVKFSSKKEKPVVEIGLKEEGDKKIFYIKDNGAGFDMKYYDKLFGMFQRLHDPAEFEGNGVGLTLVKRIINKHNGRVWAEAEVEKGATFYFTLNEEPPKNENNINQ